MSLNIESTSQGVDAQRANFHIPYDNSGFEGDKPKEECGVFAGLQQNEKVPVDVSRVVYFGAFALQHRGQEATGIASSTGENIYAHKGMGLVAHVYSEENIDGLKGYAALGHDRYSTSKGSVFEHTQPVIRKDRRFVFSGGRPRFPERYVALGHNGNLPSTLALEDFLSRHNVPHEGHNDSELMTDAVWHYMKRGASVEEAIAESYPLFTGAFSLVVMTNDKLIAVRDPMGIRPLSMGTLNGMFLFSSETCALETVHAQPIGEVRPGQMVVVDRSGVKKIQIAQGQQMIDIFEFIYFHRPDSELMGQSVYDVRLRFGKALWDEHHVDGDMVIGVPDSALPGALGYARASGIPYGDGFIKNRYIKRTFIEPEQHLRERGVALKLNPLPNEVKGKRIVMIDDSIVRGTTIGPIVKLLRQAGAKEVHVMITSPPYMYPDFYGTDTGDQSKLIAARMSVEEIKTHIGADSLHYLSLENTLKATGLPPELFCTANFNGIYPIDIRERTESVRIF